MDKLPVAQVLRISDEYEKRILTKFARTVGIKVLAAAKMKDCRWLKPVLVGQFEFVEGTSDLHLRHTRFMGLREDKKAKDVGREVAK
jgi:ATP-dependent DNA ligase